MRGYIRVAVLVGLTAFAPAARAQQAIDHMYTKRII